MKQKIEIDPDNKKNEKYMNAEAIFNFIFFQCKEGSLMLFREFNAAGGALFCV